MAKVSIVKGAKEVTTQKRREARLAKHLKRHPNDEQSASRVGKAFAKRKKPFVKGSAPKPANAYRNEAGHKLEAPSFEPAVKPAK